MNILLETFLILLLICSAHCRYFTGLEKNNTTSILLPSITYDLDLSRPLTYSALVVLNDTSAHLFTLGNDLVVRPEMANDYSTNDSYTHHKITLAKDYKSYRGEIIDSNDVVYSMNYLAQHSPYVRAVLGSIVGIDTCSLKKCKLAITAVDDITIDIKTRHPDRDLIEKLASPFLIILKLGKTYLEKIGNCNIPYQTGHAILTACDNDHQEITFKNRRAIISVVGSDSGKGDFDGFILTINPGEDPYPSLIVISMYAMPNSGLIDKTRIEITKTLMSHRRNLSDKLKLKQSYTIVSEWFRLKQSIFPGINDIQTPPVIETCPKNPIKFVLETTTPNVESIKAWIADVIPCEINVITVRADVIFNELKNADFGLMWVTPDYLDYYNAYSVFDRSSECDTCWNDDILQAMIDKLKAYDTPEEDRGVIAMQIEKHVIGNGYVAPLLQMNTWLNIKGKIKNVHPAGLAQLKVSDFF